jgi:hypothetical protein
MGMRYGIFPRLEKTHFICSKNCHDYFISHFEAIDRTAEIDVTIKDLKNSNERYKKRKLNEELIPRERMPQPIPWENLPCCEFDSSTFFSNLKSQQMFLWGYSK